MKKRLFMQNAVILTGTSLLLRTVGIFFRVYLSGKIGAEGMGLYQLIFSVYVLGSTFATSGISTAVTRLVADELACGSARGARHVLRRSLTVSLLLGGLSCLLFYCGADTICHYVIRDMRAAPALRMLSFSLPSMGVSSSLRGYFVARRRISGTSRAQLAEQAVRIAVIALLIDRFAARGLAAACLAVMIGDTVAEWLSCLYIAVGYFIDRRRLSREYPAYRPPYTHGVVRHLWHIAAPITAGRYLNTALRTAENLLVPQKLARFSGSRETGLSLFGSLKGMALPLIFFPASFLNALSTLLIPEISSANALHQKETVRRAISRALRITLLSSVLIGTVFTVFSNSIGDLLYHDRQVGIYLRVLGPLTPIMYAESIADGMLKGLDQQVSSLRYSVADSVLRLVLIVFLVPRYGMGGFLFIMVVSNLLTSFLNLNRLFTVTDLKIDWYRWIVKPLGGALCGTVLSCCVTRLPLFSAAPPIVCTAMGIATLCAGYALFLLATDSFSLPFLRKRKHRQKIRNF